MPEFNKIFVAFFRGMRYNVTRVCVPFQIEGDTVCFALH